MEFLHAFLLKLFYPTSLCLLLLLAAGCLRRRRTACRISFCLAATILLVCGNGWLAGVLIQRLERQYLPPQPVPEADCIVILSGGILGKSPPRPTIEIAEAGNRVLYGAYLYRLGRAPRIICTGGLTTGGPLRRTYAEDMAELLEFLGVPGEAILTETKAEDTRQHARNLYPLLREKNFHRVLLVTSALHMPRSMGVFERLCPGIEFIAAPTDFRVTEGTSPPWYRRIIAFIPTPRQLEDFSDVAHEYLGMAYYRWRGWM